MNRTILTFVLGLLVGASLITGAAMSQEKDEHAKYGRKMPDMSAEAQQEMMKSFMALMTPGTGQERLAYFLGEWATETTNAMGGKEAKSKGTATFRWLQENRYLLQEWKSPMMGMPFSGWAITGYDNFRKEYQTAMGSTMGTALYTASGYIDLSGRRITQYGDMDEPTMDQIAKQVKYVTRIEDADHFVFEVHDLDIADGGDGNPIVISVRYTRTK
jgi:hypothetical protein